MDSDVSPNEIEGVDPVEQLYGLFAGEDFLTDLETEHREEILRDERIIQELARFAVENISDNPPDPFDRLRTPPRHPRSISSSDSSEN